MGVSLDDSQVDLFDLYLKEILTWNKRRNLVSRRDEHRIAAYHFIDSLSALAFLPEKVGLTSLDVGSGAGFPGIPLRIARADMILSLVEPKRWRHLFLESTVEVLKLSNVTLFRTRVEDLPDNLRSYDLVLVRAVASLKSIIPLVLPRLSAGGVLIAYKSGDASRELKLAAEQIRANRGEVGEIKEVKLPISGVRRVFVTIRKQSS